MALSRELPGLPVNKKSQVHALYLHLRAQHLVTHAGGDWVEPNGSGHDGVHTGFQYAAQGNHLLPFLLAQQVPHDVGTCWPDKNGNS